MSDPGRDRHVRGPSEPPLFLLITRDGPSAGSDQLNELARGLGMTVVSADPAAAAYEINAAARGTDVETDAGDPLSTALAEAVIAGTDADLAAVVGELTRLRAGAKFAATLGMVPIGGGDLARTFGGPPDPAVALRRLAAPVPTHACELWDVSGDGGPSIPMVSGAVFGAGARWLGSVGERALALAMLRRTIEVSTPGRAWTGSASTVIVGSGQFAGGRELAARALPGDGRLEVLVHRGRGSTFPRIWQMATSGRHVERSDMARLRPTEFSLSGRRWPSRIDGVAHTVDEPRICDTGVRFRLAV